MIITLWSFSALRYHFDGWYNKASSFSPLIIESWIFSDYGFEDFSPWWKHKGALILSIKVGQKPSHRRRTIIEKWRFMLLASIGPCFGGNGWVLYDFNPTLSFWHPWPSTAFPRSKIIMGTILVISAILFLNMPFFPSTFHSPSL